MAAPVGNTNALKNGTRARITLRTLPAELEGTGKKVHKFRRAVERAVEEHYGTIGVAHVAFIHSASAHALLAELGLRWLAEKAATMTPEQFKELASPISRELDRRDAALQRLGIDKASEGPDVLSLLYGRSADANGSEHGNTAEGEPASETADQA